jgi:hypothetical protein
MNTINITVSGSDTIGNDLVTNIIDRALKKEDFTNVALVNTIGEPMVTSDVPSLMDQIVQKNPEYFATPIRIWTQSAKDVQAGQDAMLNQSLAQEAPVEALAE